MDFLIVDQLLDSISIYFLWTAFIYTQLFVSMAIQNEKLILIL